MVGVPMEVSANEEANQQALHLAMNKYNQASNNMYGSHIAQVLSVKKQNVAGIKMNNLQSKPETPDPVIYSAFAEKQVGPYA
ncbi:hypothetical protein JD844_008406 [Phrynosoma platyrhinos]|uniref:Cystatin domain-containing protein n=1 Tax=Phrynosoma platyrhinos TaxID=52577 RepID=A0ABQ7TE12_PHRPL|nr:hypothetical protein JD844_008406 [Phrynosoma platyrhinos]